MGDNSILVIVSGALGMIGLAVAIIFLLRYVRKRKLISMFSEVKLVAVEIKSIGDEKLPVSVTPVPTQMATALKHNYPPSAPDPLKLKQPQRKMEEESKNEGNFIFKVLNIRRDSKSYGALKNELNNEDRNSVGESSDDELQNGTSSAQAELPERTAGDTTPEYLPEQWSTPTFTTTVEFTVTYVNSSSILAVHITRLINLPNWKPFKSSNSHRIKIKLLHLCNSSMPYLTPPTSVESVPKKISTSVKRWGSHSSMLSSPTGGSSIKKTFDAENGAFFAFTGHDLPELRNYYLLILIYELKFKNLREKLIGEFTCTLAQLELEAGTPVRLMEEVKLKKKESENEKNIGKNRGQLLISLFYQSESNRMKVLIRKAADLPKKKHAGLVIKEYGVIVNSIYGGQIMASQETKKIHGRSPVWNQPFIIDIPEKNLEKYSLQFITFSSCGVNQPHHTIGHIVIGPDVRGSGRDHWLEAVHPKSIEATSWHKLQPLL